eukprot:scaffold12556_cov229-Ochromonas_danica.AAC.1
MADGSKKRKWPTTFFGCADAKDPASVSSSTNKPTNSIVGRVCSKLNKEPVVCCESGNLGLCICIAMIPLGVYTPAGGFGIYCCLTNYLRQRTIEEYNIEEESVCCAGPSAPPLINICFHGVCYPCSIFQVYTALKTFSTDKF